MNDEPVVLILAGGQGRRLALDVPKQFMTFPGSGESMLQKTYARALKVAPLENIFVVTLDHFVPFIDFQLSEIPPENIIGQPEDKNTGAAICLSALICEERLGDPTMIVMPCDHIISPENKFLECLDKAIGQIEYCEPIYCFGIVPDEPSPEFGYIEKGERIASAGSLEFTVASFKEKPDVETAKGFIESGKYLWNSGIFAWKVSSILEEFSWQRGKSLANLRRAGRGKVSLKAAYQMMENISVDHAIMENTAEARVLVGDFDWIDIGCKESLNKVLMKGCEQEGG